MQNFIYDSFIKKVDILSKALEKATERTRSMLYVVTFFSLIVFISSFTAYISWDRKLNAKERLLLYHELDFIPYSSIKPYHDSLINRIRHESKFVILKSMAVGDLAKDMRKLELYRDKDLAVRLALDAFIDSLKKNSLLPNPTEFFRIYMDRQKFTIPILGLSCYADDLYLIGSLGLLILLVYTFFSVRRENRIVERISVTVEYINDTPFDHYVNSAEKKHSEDEMRQIKHNLLEYVFYGCVEFFIFNTGKSSSDYFASTDEAVKRTNKSGRLVLKGTYMFPIFSMLFALFWEVKSAYDRWEHLTNNDYWELGVRYSLTISFMYLMIKQIIVINKLNTTNANLIDKMQKIIEKSRDNLSLR